MRSHHLNNSLHSIGAMCVAWPPVCPHTFTMCMTFYLLFIFMTFLLVYLQNLFCIMSSSVHKLTEKKHHELEIRSFVYDSPNEYVNLCVGTVTYNAFVCASFRCFKNINMAFNCECGACLHCILKLYGCAYTHNEITVTASYR